MARAARGPLARHWILDPAVTFLNHGSFGACPSPVLEAQWDLRRRMEEQPVRFLVRELEGLLDGARRELGDWIGAQEGDLAFVPNATAGVNTVLRSLELAEGDELLVTDQAYNACRNALDHVAAKARARVVVATLPFPIGGADDVVEAVVPLAGPRTRLALVDHVTSPTGLVLPIMELVRELQARGTDVLVDGAHAPGMVELDVDALGAAYYTGNCHKWPCAPKGAAFLHVRRDRQAAIRPLSISHGANSTRTDRSRFRIEADWVGTQDPTPWLAIPAAIRFMGSLLPGGWPALRARNRDLALAGRRHLCEALAIEAPAPESMIGSLAAVPLPDGRGRLEAPLYIDPLQDALLERHGIEVPVMPWPSWPKRLLRISAQAYNAEGEYIALAGALRSLVS
jgi:isopenicillin-N epimerase